MGEWLLYLRGIGIRSLALLTALLLVPHLAFAQSAPALPEQLYNEAIIDLVVRGPQWAVDLERNLPVHKGMFLTRDRVEHALLQFHQNAPTDLASVRAYAEEVTIGHRSGVRLIFDVAAVRHVEAVEFRDTTPLDRTTITRAAALLTGAEFWPDTVQKAAARIAAVYARAGWRETTVGWDATPGKNGLRIVFTVHRSAPTTLVEIEFIGDKGLNYKELSTAFDLHPGARLSIESIDDGIVELKARYRAESASTARASASPAWTPLTTAPWSKSRSLRGRASPSSSGVTAPSAINS